MRGAQWQMGRRQEFIESCLFWEGRINRGDLVEKFGISIPQATDDIARYMKRAPGNIDYEPKERAYVIQPGYEPVVIQPEADRYLMQLRAVKSGLTRERDIYLNAIPSFDVVPVPHRSVNTATLRSLLRAIRERWVLAITYQSMNSAKPAEREISPHSIAFDGFRWHTRAYCHKDNVFKDFVIARIIKIGKHRRGGIRSDGDRAWNEILTAVLIPNPRLTPTQQTIIALDYAMQRSKLHVEIRASFVYYFERLVGRLVLLRDRGKEAANQIEIRNLEELKDIADALAEPLTGRPTGYV